MTPKELKNIVTYMYSAEPGGQRQLAADMDTTEVTISRWATGFSPIGKVEARLIRLLYLLHRKQWYWRAAVKEMEETSKGLEDLL